MIPSASVHQINYNKFIYFHPSTKGGAGRAVYIDPQLLVRFMELVDTSTANGLEVVRGMIGLQSNAAGATSDSNLSSAFQHRHTFKNVVVTYTVLQSGGRGPGVYVTGLHHGYSKDKGRPGLYKVEPSRGDQRWAAEPDESKTMSSLIGVLGALPPAADGGTDPSETASAFADGPLKIKREPISRGFALFYTPTYVIDNMGVWLPSAQKSTNGSANLPKSFAQILANTENKAATNGGSEKYKWYIVGQGAKVFQQALQEYKHLGRHPLNRNHEFYFVDPQIPLGMLSQELRNNGIDFARDKNIIESTMSVASQMNQLLDPTLMYCNMYKPWSQFQRVNANVHDAKQVLATRNNTSMCFSDLVKNLTTTLQGKWR